MLDPFLICDQAVILKPSNI